MTGSTNQVETSMDMRRSSLPTYRYTSTRYYVANLYIGKSVHLLLGQTMYDNQIYHWIWQILSAIVFYSTHDFHKLIGDQTMFW